MEKVSSKLFVDLRNKGIGVGTMKNRIVNEVAYDNIESKVYLCHYNLFELIKRYTINL